MALRLDGRGCGLMALRGLWLDGAARWVPSWLVAHEPANVTYFS
jgi:hypothetical protein